MGISGRLFGECIEDETNNGDSSGKKKIEITTDV